MNKRMAWAGIFAVFAGSIIVAQGKQPAKKAMAAQSLIKADALQWSALPVAGCTMAVVQGDPSKAGDIFGLRIKCADGSKIPPHWHPGDEHVTVLKGAMSVGMGEKFDAAKLQPLAVGDLISIPKEMRHFAQVRGETIVQVHGTGPFAVNFVNPADAVPPAPAKVPAKKS